MDFTIDKPLAALRDKVGAFVREKIIPFEKDPRWGHHGIPEDMRHDLNKAADKAGLLGINSPKEYGGQGFSHFEQAVVFEAAGYSILGPIALHFHAPDEGNINLLEKVATPAQKAKYLKRLATGEVRSCFAMTEPDGGAGADPVLLKTRAKPDGNGFVISGRKTLITGADGAAFAIIMARTGDSPGDCTMFLTELPNPAFKIHRVLGTMDSSFMGGHAVIDGSGLGEATTMRPEFGDGARRAKNPMPAPATANKTAKTPRGSRRLGGPPDSSSGARSPVLMATRGRTPNRRTLRRAVG